MVNMQPSNNAPGTGRRIISEDVRCPLCGSEPGKPCTEPGGPTGVQSVPPRRAHLQRTIEVLASGDIPNPAVQAWDAELDEARALDYGDHGGGSDE